LTYYAKEKFTFSVNSNTIKLKFVTYSVDIAPVNSVSWNTVGGGWLWLSGPKINKHIKKLKILKKN
jgi:hypothetical protein